jgi:hypothetical protein
VALESFPPFLLGAIRFLAAGALLFGLARLRAEPMPRAIEWRSAAVTGVLFFVIGNGLVNVAEQSVSSGLASVLVATMPLWATLISRLLGERASALELAGTILGLGGVAIMNLGGELRASPGGTCAALLAPIGWALGSIASKRLSLPGTTLMRTAAQMLTGGAAMFAEPVVRRKHENRPARRLSSRSLLVRPARIQRASLLETCGRWRRATPTSTGDCGRNRHRWRRIDLPAAPARWWWSERFSVARPPGAPAARDATRVVRP